MKPVKSIFGYLFITAIFFSFACNKSSEKESSEKPDPESTIIIPVTEFNPAEYDKNVEDNKWEKLTLPKKDHTEYTLVSDADEHHIKAV
ncbi:MAG: hypothetical protein ABJH44_03205, partial [Balneola sp.]